MKPIIKVENVSKEYRIGTVQPPYQTFREALSGAVRIPFRRRSGGSQPRHETIWALKDVSFEIEPGEVVGVIGSNGAGKSTLLKILSRVTEPTTGRIELYGRIGSLLEVGTGFHPELTGRENVFLNGAILGMKRTEILRKFDEIVAFSEIEKFIDTPVKFYSTGMYLRLAFSVSAHLEPEILILDEILSVGDTAFQQKCFKKMQEIRNAGCTVVYVSHSMSTVTQLCKRAILFSSGAIVREGPAEEVAKVYLGASVKLVPERTWSDLKKAPGNDLARLRSVHVRLEDGQVSSHVDIRKPVGIEMEFEVLQPGHVLVPNIRFQNEEGLCIFHVNDSDPAWKKRPRPRGVYLSTVWVPGNFLSEGTISVGIAVSTPEPVKVHFYEQGAVAFKVIDNVEGDSARGDYRGSYPGIVRPILSWTTQCSLKENGDLEALRAEATSFSR
jgi:lipopolysaccharide transport system ATP-binding protein